MSQVSKILDAFGHKLVTDVRNSLRQKGVTFGGGADSRLSGRATFEIKETPAGIVMNLLMPEYWYWVDKGRDPGPVSKKARESIAKWVKTKGILGSFIASDLANRQRKQSESIQKRSAIKRLSTPKAVKALTFLIARKITVKGYKGNDFLKDILEDGRIERLRIDLRNAAKRDIQIMFRQP